MKTKKSKRNLSALTIRRLRAVRAAVLAEPKLYDQWNPHVPVPNSCGTAGCLLGWAVALFGQKLAPRERRPDQLVKTSMKLLRIDRLLADEIFASWPAKFNRLYQGADNNAERARVAGKFIDYVIRKDGRL